MAAKYWKQEKQKVLSRRRESTFLGSLSGPNWIRTNDRLLRRQLLYPAELWGQIHSLLSGWQDSNLRPPAPKAGAIPGYATSRTWYLLFYFPFSKGLQSNGFKLTIPFLFANFYSLRRGRDSNPRYRYQYDSLANCSFRPLRHLSFKPLFSALPALF